MGDMQLENKSLARKEPPYRAEHIGSLKRPQRLIDARNRYNAGQLAQAELFKIEDEEIARIVKLQRGLGFKTITDGEFKRFMYYDGLFENLEGFTYVGASTPEMYMPYAPDMVTVKLFGQGPPGWICTSKIRRTKPCYVPWFEALAKHVLPEEVKDLKMTMVSPDFLHSRYAPGFVYTSQAYANDEEYFADLAKAYREELDALYEAGCRHVQTDSPMLTFFCSDVMVEGMKLAGIDPDTMLARYIQLYNDCIAARKPGMKVGLHMCRGNYTNGVHFAEGGYDRVAQKLFNGLKVDHFCLEYDTPRSGGFDPLHHYPKDMPVVLGFVSSKLPELEDKADLIARLDEAARVLQDPKKERICLSPQCGFASTLEGNSVSEEEMEKKLAFVAEVAREVWGTTS